MKLQFTLARLLQDKTFEIGVPCQLRECAHIYIEFSMVYTLVLNVESYKIPFPLSILQFVRDSSNKVKPT